MFDYFFVFVRFFIVLPLHPVYRSRCFPHIALFRNAKGSRRPPFPGRIRASGSSISCGFSLPGGSGPRTVPPPQAFRRPAACPRPSRPGSCFSGRFFRPPQGPESDLTGTYNLQGINWKQLEEKIAYCVKTNPVVCSFQRHAIVCTNQKLPYLPDAN